VGELVTLAQGNIEPPDVYVSGYVEFKAVLAAPVWLVDVVAVVFPYYF